MQAEIGHYKLAVGLEWVYTESKVGIRDQLKEISKSKARAVVLTREDTGETWLGWEAGGGRQRVHAGATLVGLVTPDALIQHNLPDGRVWICVLQDGHPVPGYGDQVLSAEDAKTAFAEAFSMFNSLQPYGDVPGSRGSVAELLEKVDESLKSKGLKKSHVESMLLRTPGMDPRVAAMVVMALCVPAIGWFGWKEFQKYDTARKAAAMDAKLSAQKRMTAEQLEAERRRLRDEFAKRVAAKKAEVAGDFVHGQPAAAWESWNAVRTQTPISKGGYVPGGIDCDLTQCTTAWAGSGRFALIADKAELGADGTDPGKDVTTRTALSIAPERTPAIAWASAAHVRAAILDRLTTVQGLAVEAAQAQVESPPPDLGLAPITVGFKGAVKVQVSGPFALVQAGDLVRTLSGFPVKLSTAKFVGLGKHVTVVLEGTYVVPAAQ
ncbi:hypothetical protein FN976_10965 [Caenimonas sedimenti]|uniref:Type 4b pilus protein PilO2 n=1 Tax=Caenimonas sedimenti TaxID=2596921 RepID=A0A562ZSS8_9BURK|nr:type 4b pilus protein PilO2 [Caenimonas sedimenti]TWO71431.1 hypothetical protein FN976_10965 [Caenimonas sedimenti]